VSRELCTAGVVVVSGLAKGVDTEALKAAMEAKGRTIAVIGTPVDKVYPRENRQLQQAVYEEHLLISQFVPGKKTYPGNFPERNRLMAAISDATVIVEASNSSGSLHQAAECLRLNRWLFIAKSLLEDRSLQWPSKFTHYAKTRTLSATKDILDALQETETSSGPEKEGLKNFLVCPHCRQQGREGSWVRIQQDMPILSRSDGRHFHLLLVAGPFPQRGGSGGIVAGRAIAQFSYALDAQSLQRETVDVVLQVLDTRRERLMHAMEDAADKLASVLQKQEPLKPQYLYSDRELLELPRAGDAGT
jgi:DNA processing protein